MYVEFEITPDDMEYFESMKEELFNILFITSGEKITLNREQIIQIYNLLELTTE